MSAPSKVRHFECRNGFVIDIEEDEHRRIYSVCLKPHKGVSEDWFPPILLVVSLYMKNVCEGLWVILDNKKVCFSRMALFLWSSGSYMLRFGCLATPISHFSLWIIIFHWCLVLPLVLHVFLISPNFFLFFSFVCFVLSSFLKKTKTKNWK